MKELIEEVKDCFNFTKKFITEDVWNLNLEDFGRAKQRLIKYLKIAIYTIKEAGHDKLGFHAIALTFFSTMSLVPFAAVCFALMGGVGLKNRLQSLLLESFSGSAETLRWVIQFADNSIESITNSSFGVVSFGIFISTIIWLILNVEKSFNDIWKVERRRSIAKRLLYYIGILMVAPFLITIFLSIALVFSNALGSIDIGIKQFSSISFVVQWLAFYGIVLFVFTTMYKYIPSVKVHFWAAFPAAIISALAFSVVQYLYMETQLLVSRANAIYGAFAAIPLFLVWMNISWTIILIGAEISHAFQYVNSYNLEEH